ncbi:MAG: CBS domain-containing protein [Methanophagales archaeon]|nr:CBS domain-containing protein [Methanophagales archaeon]
MAGLLEVKDVMTYPAITEDEDVSIAAISKCMKMSGLGCVVMTKEGNPVGVVTDRDIVIKVIMKNINPDTVKAKEIMASPIVTIEAEASVDEACKLAAKKRIKRLPVVENGVPIGIVSIRDILTRKPEYVKDFYF